MQVKKVAIIGVTGFGKVHLDMVLAGCQKGYWKLAAATIINPAEVPGTIEELKQDGSAIYTDYREMMDRHNGNIDLVFIPTAIHWHAPMAIDAMRAGANVLVEKPLAGSVGEAETIEEVSRETGKFVAVGFQHLYMPGTWALKEEILNGKIGSLVRVKGLASSPRNLSYYRRNSWAGRLLLNGHPVYDSPLNNAFAHYVNLLLFLSGPDRGSSSRVVLDEARLLRAQDIESFDTAAVRGITDNGAEFLFHATHSGLENYGPIIQIEGSIGSFTWDIPNGTPVHKDASGKTTEVELRGFSHSQKNQLVEVLNELLEGGCPDFCPPSIALNHCRLIKQLHEKFPIHDFPYGEIDRHDLECVTVPGLSEKLRVASQADSLS